MTWTQRALYVARARRGIALLDAAWATGWAGRLDLARLDLASQTDDVLGQLYGDYIGGFRQLLARQPADVLFTASDHGFSLPEYEQQADPAIVLDRFAVLTEVWQQLIRERLAV